MARTRRYRKRARVGRRRFSRRRFVRRTRRYSRYSRKRVGFRFSKKRKSYSRKGSFGKRRRIGKGALLKAPLVNSNVKFVTISCDNIANQVRNVTDIAGNSTAFQSDHWFKFENSLGWFTTNEPKAIVERPDRYPPHGHTGLFVVFSLDTYIRAMAGSFFAYRDTRKVNNIVGNGYGTAGLMSPNEILLRRHNLEYNKVDLYKIGIRFKRRVRRGAANSVLIAGFKSAPLHTAGSNTTATAWHAGTGSSLDGTGDISFVPDLQNVAVLPATGGDLPWYSQSLDYLTSSNQLAGRLRVGFPTLGNDPIDDSIDAALHARVSRCMVEMGQRKEWKKNSGSSSLHFALSKKKGSGDFLRVKQDVGGVLSSLSIGAVNGVIGTGSSYDVVSDMGNVPSGSNSIETINHTIPESALFYEGKSDNVCTMPTLEGPRGSIVIWCPYNLEHLNAYYDISVYGKYRYSGKGSSCLDLPRYLADMDVLML